MLPVGGVYLGAPTHFPIDPSAVENLGAEVGVPVVGTALIGLVDRVISLLIDASGFASTARLPGALKSEERFDAAMSKLGEARKLLRAIENPELQSMCAELADVVELEITSESDATLVGEFWDVLREKSFPNRLTPRMIALSQIRWAAGFTALTDGRTQNATAGSTAHQ